MQWNRTGQESNWCMQVTVTITISLRSCYHWQAFSGIVVGRLARHRKGGGGFRVWGRWQGGSEEEGGAMGGEETCFNLGHLPVCTGSGDSASSAPNLKTHMLYWVSTWINCPNYSWYKKEGELKTEKHFSKMAWHVSPTKTYCSGTHAFGGGYLSRWQVNP